MRLLAPCALVVMLVLGCSRPPVAGGSSPSAPLAARFGYAQHGTGCSPTDGLADVYTFTRVDRGCRAQAGDEVLVVTYWGMDRLGDSHIAFSGVERGHVQTCIAERGGCASGRSAELHLPGGGAKAHLHAELADGTVVDSDFVVRECPRQAEICG